MRSANHLNVGAGLGTNVDTAFSNIAEPVEQCSSQLRALTEMIVSSKEDIDPEFMRKCRAEILSISTEVTSVCDECDQAKAVSRCFQLENDQDFASDMTIETGSTRAEKLKLALVNRMKSINPADSRLKLVAELTAALDEENEDDEIQIQRTQETGNDYICQVSQMRMKQPMKK